MKIILAVLSSCIALGVQSVGGDVVNCNAPIAPKSVPVVQTVTHSHNKPSCGCGATIIIINNVHINIHNHVNIHNNMHNNTHNNYHNKKGK